MALIVVMQSGAKHFVKGDVFPLLEGSSTFWTPIDFFGVRMALRWSRVESIHLDDDKNVEAVIAELRARTSRLAH